MSILTCGNRRNSSKPTESTAQSEPQSTNDRKTQTPTCTAKKTHSAFTRHLPLPPPHSASMTDLSSSLRSRLDSSLHRQRTMFFFCTTARQSCTSLFPSILAQERHFPVREDTVATFTTGGVQTKTAAPLELALEHRKSFTGPQCYSATSMSLAVA